MSSARPRTSRQSADPGFRPLVQAATVLAVALLQSAGCADPARIGSPGNDALEEAPSQIRIEPLETGREVVVGYHGVPPLVREALPKYTNAYVSEVEGFDYREGIAVLGTAGVSDEEMLRVRDTINVVLLADPRMRRGLAEYNAHIGVTEAEPEEGTDLLDALLMMRPIELVYTDIEGINEVGLDGEKSSVPQKLMQLLAYYPIPEAPYFAETKAALATAYETAVETGVYDPTNYLDPDFAHPGILMAPGAYLGLAYEIYHGMPAGPSEYQIRDREDMSTRDPLMLRFLDFTRPEWFDYGQLLQDYANEIHRLDELGMLEREARTDTQ